MLLAGTILFYSCSDNKAAEEVANTFIQSYYTANYDAAMAVSDTLVSSNVAEGKAMIASLPDTIRTEFLELAAMTNSKMKEVLRSSKDSVEFLYEIYFPESFDVVSNKVLVVRNSQTGEWKVTGIML